MLRVLPGPFGAAEVVGLQVDDYTDASTRTMLRAALVTHAVVCVRQPRALDDNEARGLASMLGPITPPR